MLLNVEDVILRTFCTFEVNNRDKFEIKTKMEFEQMLKKCGDFGRFQIIMLSLFAIINILASIHYYSQTIISFVPEHW